MALYIKHPITCILSNVQLDEDIRNTKCYRFRYKKMQMSCDQNSGYIRHGWTLSNDKLTTTTTVNGIQPYASTSCGMAIPDPIKAFDFWFVVRFSWTFLRQAKGWIFLTKENESLFVQWCTMGNFDSTPVLLKWPFGCFTQPACHAIGLSRPVTWATVVACHGK